MVKLGADRNITGKIAQAIELREFVLVDLSTSREEPMPLVISVKGLRDQWFLAANTRVNIARKSKRVHPIVRNRQTHHQP